MDVGYLISGSSAFSKSNLNIWDFTVHVLLKPDLENFEHYFVIVWGECNCAVVWNILWHWLSLGLERKLTFSSPVATAEFSKFADNIECSTLTASTIRIWNSSAGIPSPPLALFIVMLPKALLTSHSILALDEWSHHHDYPGCEELFCTFLLCILATSSKYLLLLLGSYHSCPLLNASLHEMFLWYL